MRRHLPLVHYLARRFRGRGEPLDDLVQVGHHRSDQGGGPVRPRARRRVLHVRDADRRRGDQAALPRQGLGGPGAAPAAGAARSRSPGHRELSPDARPLPDGRRARRAPAAHARRRCWRRWSRPTHTRRCRSTPPTRRRGALAVARPARRRGRPALEGVEYRESLEPLLGALPRAGAADPDAALLREHDAVADRRRDRHLPDARVPAAGRTLAQLREGWQRRVIAVRLRSASPVARTSDGSCGSGASHRRDAEHARRAPSSGDHDRPTGHRRSGSRRLAVAGDHGERDRQRQDLRRTTARRAPTPAAGQHAARRPNSPSSTTTTSDVAVETRPPRRSSTALRQLAAPRARAAPDEHGRLERRRRGRPTPAPRAVAAQRARVGPGGRSRSPQRTGR